MLEISVASSVKSAKASDFSIFLTRSLFVTLESSTAIFLTTKVDLVLKYFMSSSPKDSKRNNREISFERAISSFDSRYITEKIFLTQNFD